MYYVATFAILVTMPSPTGGHRHEDGEHHHPHAVVKQRLASNLGL